MFLFQVDRKLLEDATPISDWREKIPISQTHYADEINYGEWCIVLFKFKCDIPGDVQLVRKTLTQKLGVSGQLDNKIIGKKKKNRWPPILAD